MTNAVNEVEEIHASIRILALNAGIKTARSGKMGAAIGSLAVELLKQSLREALAAAAGTTLQMDLRQTTALDITALQLLWAAARDAEQKQIVFGVAQPVPDTVGATVREAGFEKRLLPGCPPRENVAGTEPCPGP
jgi:anti-anti-sigma regulatory factor